MDFMLALPPDHEGLDCALLVACKFLKELIIVTGNKRWTAPQWAEKLLDKL